MKQSKRPDIDLLIPALLLVLMILESGCVEEREGVVSGTVNITGSATPGDGTYRLEIGEGSDPDTWTQVGVVLTGNGQVDVEESLLAYWDTEETSDGRYTVRLTVTDGDGVSSEDRVYVTVDNTPRTPTKECPVWDMPSLVKGSNDVDISVSQDGYGSNMECSVTARCPAGMNMGIYSEGDLEYNYDFLYFGDYALTSYWSGFDSPYNSTEEIRFASDQSIDGSDGYSGFNVSGIVCTPYCISRSFTYSTEYISRVWLNSRTRSSGGNYYSSFMESSFTTLRAGGTYELQVDVTTSDVYEEYVKAWIDYDQDLTLEDGEEIYVGEGDVDGTYTFEKSFEVPDTALPGYTLLRVSDKYYSEQTSCEEFYYGEVEDYLVYIENPYITNCTIPGDYTPCGEVTIVELANHIQDWAQGEAELSDVQTLVGMYVSG